MALSRAALVSAPPAVPAPKRHAFKGGGSKGSAGGTSIGVTSCPCPCAARGKCRTACCKAGGLTAMTDGFYEEDDGDAGGGERRLIFV